MTRSLATMRVDYDQVSITGCKVNSFVTFLIFDFCFLFFFLQMHIKTLDNSNNALLNKRRKRVEETSNHLKRP